MSRTKRALGAQTLVGVITHILHRTDDYFEPGHLRKPRRGGMFIDADPTHHFLFVFQRRGSDAGLKLTSAGLERISTVRRTRGRAAEKQKELSVGCSVYKHATPTGFPRQQPIPQIPASKRISNHFATGE